MLAYLHGFASSPASAKAVAFRERFESMGVRVAVPDLEEGGFESLTISRMAGVVERALGGDEHPILVGSSLGGYVAALCASRRPVAALVLVAPAFDFARRLVRRHGAKAIERWRRRGWTTADHATRRRPERLSWDIMEDARRQDPFPVVTAPTLVFQGDRDDVVDPADVRGWVERTPSARLAMLEAGHDVERHVARILDESVRFLAGIPEVVAAHPGIGRARLG